MIATKTNDSAPAEVKPPTMEGVVVTLISRKRRSEGASLESAGILFRHRSQAYAYIGSLSPSLRGELTEARIYTLMRPEDFEKVGLP